MTATMTDRGSDRWPDGERLCLFALYPRQRFVVHTVPPRYYGASRQRREAENYWPASQSVWRSVGLVESGADWSNIATTVEPKEEYMEIYDELYWIYREKPRHFWRCS